jgi:hypothetical protein
VTHAVEDLLADNVVARAKLSRRLPCH